MLSIEKIKALILDELDSDEDFRESFKQVLFQDEYKNRKTTKKTLKRR